MTIPAAIPVTPPAAKAHLVQLDGIRAIAALAVIAQHFTAIEDYTRVPVGYLGVWVFFVLSGFLITGILRRVMVAAGDDREKAFDAWKAFYGRRVLRIFPLYYATLLVAALIDLPGVRQSFTWYFWHLGNVAFALPGVAAEPLKPFWSLAVEEQFYLVWPAVVLFGSRRAVLGAGLAMVILAPISRLAMISATSGRWEFAMALPPSCLDGLGMGALLALGREAGPAARAGRRRALGVALAAGLALAGLEIAGRFAHVGYRLPFAVRFTAYSLASAWLIDRAADGFRGWAGAILSWRPLTYVGRISYGVYVLHWLVPDIVARLEAATALGLHLPPEPGPARFAYVTAASIVLASLSWYAMERPINELKRFFPYARREPTGPAEAGSSRAIPAASIPAQVLS